MLATVVAFALAVTQPSVSRRPAVNCSLKAIGVCANSQELATTPEFRQALLRFARPVPGSGIDGMYGHIWTQAVPALGYMWPGQPLEKVDGGMWLVRGAIAREEWELGAVLLNQDGAVVALAVLTDQYAQPSLRWDLDVFVARTSQSKHWFLVMRSWADREVALRRGRNPGPGRTRLAGPLHKTRLHWVAGE